MCLTIPGKIESIDSKGVATVISHRERAQIDLSLVFDVKPGDWILYATNRAVKAISEEDAKEIISLLEDKYNPVDVSRLSLKFKKIIYKVRSGDSNLTKDEIIYLFSLKGKNNLETLYAEANTLRKERIKDFVCIHGIIEFSNYCKNNCLYCGIRKDNQGIDRYRLGVEEIVEVAGNAVENEGYKLLVLQSGEDENYSDSELIQLVREIKKKMRVFIFLSVGERSVDFYKEAYESGATGALIRFEISNQKLYAKMRPGHKFDDRKRLIQELIKTGYYVATGSLFGLPGQTIGGIADDLIFMKSLKAPMLSAGPFLLAKNTPLSCHPRAGEAMTWGSNISDGFPIGSGMTRETLLELTLKYIAIARFLMPEIKIPVTTALETLDLEGRHLGLLAGANALMFNLTPEKYCKSYAIYDDKYREREKVWQKYGLFKGEESWEMIEQRLRVVPEMDRKLN
ncbi:MAG: HypC/HybG/HupF family hydrogenase formation chaperone [Candidatus Berkelbacteria bacterium]|nr:HypC/HybG/HupF family hydrogenase formation chaperone [Candidatus Berkelbacteria bacterium]